MSFTTRRDQVSPHATWCDTGAVWHLVHWCTCRDTVALAHLVHATTPAPVTCSVAPAIGCCSSICSVCSSVYKRTHQGWEQAAAGVTQETRGPPSKRGAPCSMCQLIRGGRANVEKHMHIGNILPTDTWRHSLKAHAEATFCQLIHGGTA